MLNIRLVFERGISGLSVDHLVESLGCIREIPVPVIGNPEETRVEGMFHGKIYLG